jgi:hypothetical protein
MNHLFLFFKRNDSLKNNLNSKAQHVGRNDSLATNLLDSHETYGIKNSKKNWRTNEKHRINSICIRAQALDNARSWAPSVLCLKFLSYAQKRGGGKGEGRTDRINSGIAKSIHNTCPPINDPSPPCGKKPPTSWRNGCTAPSAGHHSL